MSKIILTIAIVISVGIFSLIKTNTAASNAKTTTLHIQKVSVSNGVPTLATAD